jgi:hypothetical protein
VVVVMPIWMVLSAYFKTYEHSYFWVTTVAYLSGSFPAFISAAVFVVVLAVSYFLIHRIKTSNVKRRTSLVGDLKIKESLRSTLSYYATAVTFW